MTRWELAAHGEDKYGEGMSRSLIIACLIANLLACPLRCLSCQLAPGSNGISNDAPSSSTQETSGIIEPDHCACCRHDEFANATASKATDAPDQPGENRSTTPGSDDCPGDECSCLSCICEGATLENRPWTSMDVHPVGYAFASAQNPFRRHSLVLAVLATTSPVIFDGRAARVENQRWLI